MARVHGDRARPTAGLEEREETLSEEELSHLKAWAIDSCRRLSPGAAETVWVIATTMEASRKRWNEISTTQFQEETGLSRTGQLEILRQLARDNYIYKMERWGESGVRRANAFTALYAADQKPKKNGARHARRRAAKELGNEPEPIITSSALYTKRV